ncbi:MAG: TRAP transporter TatT component family protein [Candidatus Rokuibacteriota bacterium]
MLTSTQHTMLALVLIALTLGQAHAQSHVLGELDAAASQYHRDPTQLDRLRTGLESAVAADPHPANWIGLSRISFLWGDIRATTREQKLDAYERGRQAGQRAIELAPRDPTARFWYATNTGRWGQTNGVVRSIFLLPTVREHLAVTLELDPNFTGAHLVMGYIYYDVPRLLGGDLDKAEESFRAALRQVPTFTTARVGLARTLAKKGKIAEARREAQAVLDETAPFNPADWTMKDTRDARKLLELLKGKS